MNCSHSNSTHFFPNTLKNTPFSFPCTPFSVLYRIYLFHSDCVAVGRWVAKSEVRKQKTRPKLTVISSVDSWKAGKHDEADRRRKSQLPNQTRRTSPTRREKTCSLEAKTQDDQRKMNPELQQDYQWAQEQMERSS